MLSGRAALLRLARPLWDFLPPCFDAPGELAILAARSLDMPLSLSASYCFSFLTLADFDGIASSLLFVAAIGGPGFVNRHGCMPHAGGL